MHVSHGRSGQPSEQRTATFTGTVHMDPVIWAEPGEEHWHGACGDSLLTHMAVSHGTTEWDDEVGESDYTAAQP